MRSRTDQHVASTHTERACLAAVVFVGAVWVFAASASAQTQEVWEGIVPLRETLSAEEIKWARNTLAIPLDGKKFRGRMSVKESLERVYEEVAAKGAELPIVVDTYAFERTAKLDVNAHEIGLSQLPDTVTVSDALQRIAIQIPYYRVVIMVRPGHFEITTREEIAAERAYIRSDRIPWRWFAEEGPRKIPVFPGIPLDELQRPLFSRLMPLAAALVVMTMAAIYLRMRAQRAGAVR